MKLEKMPVELGKKNLRLIVFLVSAIHASLLGWSAWQHSPVFGELEHLPAGISHIQNGHFDIYRVTPPLIRMIAATPVSFTTPQTDWSAYQSDPLVRSEFRVAQDFLTINSPRVFWLFTLARWACIPLSLTGGLICFAWARRLYGDLSGVLALILWSFSPNTLGHAATISADAHSGAIGVSACFFYWRWLKQPTWGNAALSGLVLGLAELAKTTLVVLYPVFLIQWGIQCWADRSKTMGDLWIREVKMISFMIILSVYVINLCYGFEGSMQRLGDYRFLSQAFTGMNSDEIDSHFGANRFSGTWMEAVPVPLPKNYVQGVDAQKRDFEQVDSRRKKYSYLRGEWRSIGWWYFYLYALAVKIPVGTWGLILLATFVVLFKNGYVDSKFDEFSLILPITSILILVSSQNMFTIHFRYVLPILPFAFIWVSKLARSVPLRHYKVLFVAALSACWMVVSSLCIYPHSLSYFNEIAGGPRNGHFHLLDSNIGWGQDLKYLKGWYDDHPEARPFYFASFGHVDPRIAGIAFQLPPIGPASRYAKAINPDDKSQGPLPGWYAIDVNHLRGVKHPAADGQGNWRYAPSESDNYYYFRNFQPIAMAGYSIYIYHITLADANRVRQNLGLSRLPDTTKQDFH